VGRGVKDKTRVSAVFGRFQGTLAGLYPPLAGLIAIVVASPLLDFTPGSAGRFVF
jgi:hypothetical protein